MSAMCQIDNGSFIKHFLILLVIGTIGFTYLVIFVVKPVVVDDYPIFSLIGSASLLFSFFHPIILVGDKSDKIPELKKYNQDAKKNGRQKVRVSHPKTPIVWLLFVGGIFTFGVLWIFALIVASGTHYIKVPDNIAILAGIKEVSRSNSSTNAQELVSLKSLLDQGILTQDQFEEKKKQLGF